MVRRLPRLACRGLTLVSHALAHHGTARLTWGCRTADWWWGSLTTGLHRPEGKGHDQTLRSRRQPALTSRSDKGLFRLFRYGRHADWWGCSPSWGCSLSESGPAILLGRCQSRHQPAPHQLPSHLTSSQTVPNRISATITPAVKPFPQLSPSRSWWCGDHGPTLPLLPEVLPFGQVAGAAEISKSLD